MRNRGKSPSKQHHFVPSCMAFDVDGRWSLVFVGVLDGARRAKGGHENPLAEIESACDPLSPLL